jgi:hypothetical protein
VSAIDDIVAALQSVSSGLEDAGSATSAAVQETDQAISQASALGTTQVVSGLTSVKDTIDRLMIQIRGAVDVTKEAIALAQAVASGT